jgi:hypothetical protein
VGYGSFSIFGWWHGVAYFGVQITCGSTEVCLETTALDDTHLKKDSDQKQSDAQSIKQIRLRAIIIEEPMGCCDTETSQNIRSRYLTMVDNKLDVLWSIQCCSRVLTQPKALFLRRVLLVLSHQLSRSYSKQPPVLKLYTKALPTSPGPPPCSLLLSKYRRLYSDSISCSSCRYLRSAIGIF